MVSCHVHFRLNQAVEAKGSQDAHGRAELTTHIPTLYSKLRRGDLGSQMLKYRPGSGLRPLISPYFWIFLDVIALTESGLGAPVDRIRWAGVAKT